MSTLVFKYNTNYPDNEIVPMEVTMPVNKEDNLIVLRFTEESFRDVIGIAKNHGLNITIEE